MANSNEFYVDVTKREVDGFGNPTGVASKELTRQPAVIFHAASTLAQSEKAITAADWEDLAGVITTPEFFMYDLTKALGRIVGDYQAAGSGVELRVVEQKAGDADVVIAGPKVLVDSAGAWAMVSFSTTAAPRTGQNRFVLQGRLNGATSAKIRYTSMSLLELR